ncbi:MAG: hypothetical protein COW00_00435 [Bdellovibrio sp. CG12_big_fil_rev_8_21_14_0_65_39_13]|nr:MAG: hypothetical protein COW78_04185 [Bdellovibrio sp. CG22_combo_CG10-13_8_21_14_all_39_27]PIQ62950.1 MAG: hypothetical protein COW00_00435 [Bdellovibrio sp. CG12_big_fil_rev_8_21_14_0_65_39_13]PIR32582.1 MAG: hypothetical protein COV37_19410 [Bdellovibrio sp. CG11_big_fil_rev_8_21_14_0_20_39_38]
MKTIVLSVLLAMTASLSVAHADMLLMDEEKGQIFLVSDTQEKIQDSEDRATLNNDFNLASKITDNIVIDGQVLATVMMIGGRVNVGVTALNRALELGIDAELLFIAAGTNGAINPNFGSYVKVRLTPNSDRTVYFKGRVMKSFNLNEDIRDIVPEFGIGYEKNDAFFEVSVRIFHDNVEGDNFFLPMFSFGYHIKGKKKDEAKLFN